MSAPDRTGVTALPGPTRLVATRLPLAPGPTIDPYDLAGPRDIVFVAGGRTLVGSGRAMTIPLPYGLDGATDVLAVTEVLAALPFDDRLGAATSGVLAFGALPFDRSDRSSLMVPEVTYVREASGQEWVTVVTPDPSALPSGPEATRAWLAARSRTFPGSGEPGSDPTPHRPALERRVLPGDGGPGRLAHRPGPAVQGGAGPPGRGGHARGDRRQRTAPPMAPARARLCRLRTSRRRRPVRRGQPGAAHRADGRPGAQPTLGRHHRSTRRPHAQRAPR